MDCMALHGRLTLVVAFSPAMDGPEVTSSPGDDASGLRAMWIRTTEELELTDSLVTLPIHKLSAAQLCFVPFER